MQVEQRVWPQGMDIGTFESPDSVRKHTGHSQALSPSSAPDDVIAHCTQYKTILECVYFSFRQHQPYPSSRLSPIGFPDLYRSHVNIHTAPKPYYKPTNYTGVLYLEKCTLNTYVIKHIT